MAIQLYLAATRGKPLVNLSRRATSCVMEFDIHGEASLAATIRMPRLAEQFRYYDREAGLDLVVTDVGREVWRGRLEEPTVASGGFKLVAYGTWRALSDTLHTAMWSDTRFGSWRIGRTIDDVQWKESSYEIRISSDITIMARNGETVGSTSTQKNAVALYDLPHRSSRAATNLAVDFSNTHNRGAGWTFGCSAYSLDWDTGAASYLGDPWSAPTSDLGAVLVSLPANTHRVTLYLRYTGVDTSYGATTGAEVTRFSDVRITTTPLAVNTTLSANASAGATSITLTSATEAAKVVVGMALYIGNATTPERVAVTSVSGTTIGITALAAAKVSGNTVRAQAVRSTDIAAGLISEMSATNPVFVRSVGRLPASTADYSDETYLDTPPAKIFDALAFAEDRVAIARNGMVGFRAKSDDRYANTWYVDATDLEISRLLDSVRNRLYAIYSDPNNRTLRQDKTAAANNNRPSQRRYGAIREGSLGVSTTSATIAAEQMTLRLADSADPAPKIQVAFERLRSRSGQRVRPTQVRGGDILVIRNLSRSLSANIDQVASFRIARYTLDVMTLKPSVEAEVPPDSLEQSLARPTAPEFDTPIGQLNAWEKPIRFSITPVPK